MIGWVKYNERAGWTVSVADSVRELPETDTQTAKNPKVAISKSFHAKARAEAAKQFREMGWEINSAWSMHGNPKSGPAHWSVSLRPKGR